MSGSSDGTITKRCGCRDDDDGRQLGARCPRLRRRDGGWSATHGTWGYTITVPGPGGKRRRVQRGGYATGAEARTARDAARQRASKGVTGSDLLTVGGHLSEWIKSKEAKRSTLREYRRHVAWWTEQIGHVRLTDLRPSHIREAIDPLNLNLSAASRQRYKNTLSSALTDAIRAEQISSNPARVVTVKDGGARPAPVIWTAPRVEHWHATGELPGPVRVWPAEIATAFLTHVGQVDADLPTSRYTAWWLALVYGMRRGELCGLRWRDLDTDGEYPSLSIEVTRLTDRGTEYDDTPKTAAGRRTVPLIGPAVEVLRSHRRRQVADRLRAGPGWTDSGKVLVVEDGAAVDPDKIGREFAGAIRAAGVPPIRLHDARHSAVTLLRTRRVPEHIIQAIVGHSSLAMTTSYGGVEQEVMAEGLDAAAAGLPGAPAGPACDTSVTQS